MTERALLLWSEERCGKRWGWGLSGWRRNRADDTMGWEATNPRLRPVENENCVLMPEAVYYKEGPRDAEARRKIEVSERGHIGFADGRSQGEHCVSSRLF